MAGKTATTAPDLGEEQVLVLQGGGALGAYQAGAYETLSQSGIEPEWLAGISIGAINAALIAGNPPGRRAARLAEFWETVTSSTALWAPLLWPLGRGAMNEAHAGRALAVGVPGFFIPRVPPPTLRLPASAGARSYYDTAPLRETLLRLVDFDYLNAEGPRLSVGAVNVETGNMTWFDSARHAVGPEHVMASGALPPGFPPVEIDGALYWDGGLVSNSPLHYVLDEEATGADTCLFQIDLFSARGAVPATVWDAETRIKDIRYSSRTRFNTDMMRRMYEFAEAAQRLQDKLPEELRDDPDLQALTGLKLAPRLTIVHLIYRQAQYERHSKDYEFSRLSMRDHWDAGARDVTETLANADWTERKRRGGPVKVFDLTRDSR
ncbi:DUF3734 domain-containing protein [Acidimangrovimonas pyrenivorans]|uniref:DUF3734 domain-containing protein n=1 Tax=Acidimangrovimonas pyrenivorans TaxID=2030798 RepID=A0ABV7AC63_9RHOB